MDQRDFIGFSFNGVHSSDLGILHVSDGNWYEETLHPEIEDRRTGVVGRDGEYYYGSDYRSKTITIQIAFDHVTETQFRQITYLFSAKKPGKLIFDERPWKEYTVKISSPITLNYVCFDEEKIIASEEPQKGIRITDRPEPIQISVQSEVIDEVSVNQELFSTYYPDDGTYEFVCTLAMSGMWECNGEPIPTAMPNLGILFDGYGEDGDIITITVKNNYNWEQIYPYIHTGEKERIYKGEGSIEFICSSPLARAPFKTLESYEETDMVHGNLVTTWSNIDEWGEASGILTRQSYEDHLIDRPVRESDGFSYLTYNPGDVDAPFSLYIPFDNNGKITGEDGQFIVNLPSGTMIFEEIETKDESGKETGIVINTANHLIEGVKYDATEHESWSTTGNIYNEYLLKGYFPKIIHYGPFDLVTDLNSKIQKLQVVCDTSGMDLAAVRLFYDYLYY